MNKNKGWIAVDLDGTLAHYDKWTELTKIGEPIPDMVERVKKWLTEGREVRIFTARADARRLSSEDFMAVCCAIWTWCEKHVGELLTITNEKDWDMIELWDDRTVAVEKNTGRQLSPSRLDE